MEGGETEKTEETYRLQEKGKERGKKKEGRKKGLLHLWYEGYFKMKQSYGLLNTSSTVPPS